MNQRGVNVSIHVELGVAGQLPAYRSMGTLPAFGTQEAATDEAPDAGRIGAAHVAPFAPYTWELALTEHRFNPYPRPGNRIPESIPGQETIPVNVNCYESFLESISV